MLIPLRLRVIASFIKPGEVVADVGADHGLLELYLIARNTNNFVVAIENKKGPYINLRENLIGLKDVRLSYSNGLTAVDSTVDTVVLAGMGGLNIINILDKYPRKVKKLSKIIIDAHRDNFLARKTIVDYGFKITDEQIVFEKNKFYLITAFERTDAKFSYTNDELEFGISTPKDPLWNEYKAYLIEKSERNLANVAKGRTSKKQEDEIKDFIKRLNNYGKN